MKINDTIQVTLRCGSPASLSGRGNNVLIGARADAPIVWNRNGQYRWDGVEHPWDIVSDIPAWERIGQA